MIEALEQLLAKGRDSAELRFGLGKGYLARGDGAQAVAHLQQCVAQKPAYTAAWKLLGKAYQLAGQRDRAVSAWSDGIAVAEKNGDKQAEKEMRVFLKRIQQTK